jgi:hypothetical protein
MAEPKARLRLTWRWLRRAERTAEIVSGQEHQQRDDHAHEGLREADRLDAGLDGGRLHLR